MIKHLTALGIFSVLAMLPPAAWSQQSTEQGVQLRERTNSGTVGVIAGGVTGTYIRVASDLANVLDDGDDLRVLAVLGKGSVQNITDILYLRGIDVGIVQSDVLAFVKREGKHPTIGNRLRYITKLYNEEFHLLAGAGVDDVQALAGKKVNVGVQGSGTAMTASIVFETLGLNIEPVSFDQALAVQKIRSGEIAAMVYVAGKPTSLFQKLEPGDGLHFLPIEYKPALMETYLPSRLSNADYPQLVTGDEAVQTLAVGAVMAVYNWAPGSARYRKVSRFVDAFFGRFDEFQQSPRHPKWKEVSLTAAVPGWSRFGAADEWLRSQAPKSESRLEANFNRYLEQRAADGESTGGSEKAVLFKEFLRWQEQNRQ